MKVCAFRPLVALSSLTPNLICAGTSVEETGGRCAAKGSMLLQSGLETATASILYDDTEMNVAIKVRIGFKGDNFNKCSKICNRNLNCKGKKGSEKESCIASCKTICKLAVAGDVTAPPADSTAAPVEPTADPAERTASLTEPAAALGESMAAPNDPTDPPTEPPAAPTATPAGELTGPLPEPQYTYYISTGNAVHIAASDQTMALQDRDCDDPSVKIDVGLNFTAACTFVDISASATAACAGKFVGDQCEFDGPKEDRGFTNYKSICHDHNATLMCFAMREQGCVLFYENSTYSPPGARCISQWTGSGGLWTPGKWIRGLSVCRPKPKNGHENKTVLETECKGGYNP